MKQVKTVKAEIFLGLREGYTENYSSQSEIFTTLRNYCTKHKLAVTLTNTKFIYVNGYEDGMIIGLINYPRFPNTKEKIKDTALNIAELLMYKFKQYRISVIIGDETIMLENNNIKDDHM